MVILCFHLAFNVLDYLPNLVFLFFVSFVSCPALSFYL